MRKSDSLIFTYIYLAVGCGVVGVIFTFILLLTCQYLSIDIAENLWLLALPATLSILLNILFIELYSKYKKR